jgi:hypothetical protein
MDIMNVQIEDTYTEGYIWSAWEKQESNWKFIIGNYDTLDEVRLDINTRLYPLILSPISESEKCGGK